MARSWKPSRAHDAPQSPATIHEICRRYYACALTLAKVMGVPLSETFLKEYHPAIASCFIESGRAGVQLPASVALPPLAPAHRPAGDPEPPTSGQAGGSESNINPHDTFRAEDPKPLQESAEEANGDRPLPTTIPADGDLPCRGQEIATLKPAALAMLISKTATLVHAEGAGWAPLLAALQAERARRLAQGRHATAR
jgi:hypothetical protein